MMVVVVVMSVVALENVAGVSREAQMERFVHVVFSCIVV